MAQGIRRKRLEEERADLLARERAARAEAEAANRAKDRLLALLGHELRTPLNPVLLAVSATLDDPATPPEIRDTLEMARRNLELEARLIDDLLDATSAQRRPLQLNREVVDLHDLIHRTLAFCRAELNAAGLHLTLDLAAECPHVSADVARMQQVVWSLIRNAAGIDPLGRRPGDPHPQRGGNGGRSRRPRADRRGPRQRRRPRARGPRPDLRGVREGRPRALAARRGPGPGPDDRPQHRRGARRPADRRQRRPRPRLDVHDRPADRRGARPALIPPGRPARGRPPPEDPAGRGRFEHAARHDPPARPPPLRRRDGQQRGDRAGAGRRAGLRPDHQRHRPARRHRHRA